MLYLAGCEVKVKWNPNDFSQNGFFLASIYTLWFGCLSGFTAFINKSSPLGLFTFFHHILYGIHLRVFALQRKNIMRKPGLPVKQFYDEVLNLHEVLINLGIQITSFWEASCPAMECFKLLDDNTFVARDPFSIHLLIPKTALKSPFFTRKFHQPDANKQL